MNNAVVPLKVPGDLALAIKRASKITNLSQADVMRQSMRLGLPGFVNGYPKPDAAPSSVGK